MKKLLAILFIVAGMTVASSTAFAQMMKENPMVGGAAMYPSKTIVANAMNSADHTTLVAAVKAAGLVDKLNSKGPFTVFAPTNAAFEQLPAGTVDSLLKPVSCGRWNVRLEGSGTADQEGPWKGPLENSER